MSYCDDCIHKEVCMYLKDVQKYEQKAPAFTTGTDKGPIVSYQVRCSMKLVGEIVERN